MRVANAERAVIDDSKIREYLLSDVHPVGRFKATFFRRLGYTTEDWKRLQLDLLDQLRSTEVHDVRETPYGQKYEIRATLRGPNGRSARVVSIWIVLRGQDHPRFVTTFPGTPA